MDELAAETSLSVPAVEAAIQSQRRVDGMLGGGGGDSGREQPGAAPRSSNAAHAAAPDEDSPTLAVAEGEIVRRCRLSAGWRLCRNEVLAASDQERA